MGKSRHFRPEERSIHRAKPSPDRATKYKHSIYNVEEDEVEILDDWTDEDWDDWKNQ
jgi:hypothetical protein